MDIIILIQLLLAHVLTDFVFQTTKGVKRKKANGFKSGCFKFHIFLSGFLTYIILQQWTNWQIPLFIMITHGIIDYWKIIQERKIDKENVKIKDEKKKKTGSMYFFIDQLLHLLMIVIAWLFITNGFDKALPFLQELITDKNTLTVLTALIILAWPVGIAIGKITEPFRKELVNTNDSLSKAGQYIGIFERLLVFIFIIIGQYAAIGFLIASKSILRVSTDKDEEARKKTEYVLIGTLISFTAAIIISLLVKYIIKY